MNIVEVKSADGDPAIAGLAVPLTDSTRAALAAGRDGPIHVGIRPEHLVLVGAGEAGISGEVTVVEELGSEAFVHVAVEHEGATENLVVRVDGQTAIGRGDRVTVAFDGPTHVFAADGARIGD